MRKPFLIVKLMMISCAVFVGASLVLSSVASAAAAPSVTTGPAGNVAFTTSSLFGDVDPNGATTTWYFEYGHTLSFGETTAVTSAGAGTATVPVSVSLTALQPGTLYYFRLVREENAGGTVVGSNGTFQTPSSVPSALTASASAVGDTGATISGIVDPKGLDTVVLFEYGTSSSYGLKTSAQSVGNGTASVVASRSLTGLAKDTTYHFRIEATNAIGTVTGADAAFTTSGPAEVTTGSSTAISATAMTVNGTVNPSGHTTTWFVQYGTTTSYGADSASHSAGSTSGVQDVSISLGGLKPGTLYHYRFVAKSSEGTVVGADETSTTLGPTIALSQPSLRYGQFVVISGVIPTLASNDVVTIFAQRETDLSFAQIATVLTGSGGAWTYRTNPRLGTTYKVLWNGVASPTAFLSVRPAVSLRTLSGTRFQTHVNTAHSLAGHSVRLQRRNGGSWRTISTARLGKNSTAIFQPHLSVGRFVLRVMITPFQAGVGYTEGLSQTRDISMR